MRLFLMKMREHLLFCILITLLSGNIADIFPFYDDTLTQNQDFSLYDDPRDYRLPTDIKPLWYEIMMIPNLNDGTFKGLEKIEIEAVRQTESITLHVGNIEIKSVNVLIINENELSTNQVLSAFTSYDNITEKFTIKTSQTLGTPTTKKAVISFTFNGILSDNMIGFYRSSYFDENDKIKRLATTQFETTHARHAFPCFDEPRFKAKFTIRVAREGNYKTLSNMPMLNSEVLEPGLKYWDTYEQSIPMSTYLVAFMMSEFDFVQNDQTGLNFTVWSKSSTINQTQYASEIGPQVLEIFKTKFEEDYPLAKMDMVAVPDFAAGAMENWGLVTYRESRILYDETESSVIAKQRVASTIAHELAHMWFGNLITPEWWSYFWLSEGFGRYYQYFGVAELEPKWKMDEQFVVEQHQSALIADALDTSLPMTRDVVDKSQIERIGDTITYNKGASIVRMISLIFGNQIFEDSLRSYIQNNKEKGLGHPDALWEAIQKQIDKESVDPRLKVNVKTVMDTWTTQPGYPLLNVTIKDKDVISITQERFLLRNLEEVSTNAVWHVPITFTTQSNPNFSDLAPKYLLSSQESTASYKVDPNEWVIFNVQSSGFYRVNYDKLGWKKILDSLTTGNLEDIPILNRAGIVDDLLNLARIGYQNYDMVFEGLLSYLKRETNYLPFKAARNGFEYVNNRFTGRPAHFLYKVYIQSLIEPIHDQLGYEDNENDDRFTILLRQEVNNWLCDTDDSECITTYTEKFKQWRENGTRIKPNERTTAYCVAVRHGSSEDWKFLWEEYYKSNYPSDQTVILDALGCSQNTTILEQYLGYAITDYETNRIRKHDSKNVFAAVYNSGLLGAEYVLDFVQKYYKKMENYYGGQSMIATILDGASQRLSTYESVDKFEKLIYDHIEDFASIETALNYSLKVAKSELEWYDSYSSYMIPWLEENDGKSFRLPIDIIPKSYFLSIAPNFLDDDYTVDGNVSIRAKVEKLTNRIVLHSSGIKYDKIFVTANGQNVDISKINPKERSDLYVIYLNEKLKVGMELVINITYTSYLNATELKGFFKSSYMNENGERRWLAASHLEPVGARRMFPCFDEPAMKAKFTIEVDVLPDYEAISNMDWSSQTKDNGRVVYSFFESREMSTYLVSVIVSDFKRKSIKVNETTFAVYARPNAIDQTDHALSVISPLVNFFEDTYKQKYPINKLFMAALPDFSSGAMENWGLLTYRESNMLYDENHSPITNKQDITNVIAHEISHQWFGNLVSPVWWKYLWLNEGFARYFEYHAPARVFEDKNALESQFVVNEVHSAFRADSSKSTHPLSHNVFTPRQIQGLFDTITYAKGASILRMVEKTFGTDLFNNALIHYLENHKYKAVRSEDLYESLQLEIYKAGLKDDIKTILNTWTTQSGYPIVNVYIKNESITVKQERFFFEKHESDFDNTIWHIPITWASVEDSSDYTDTTSTFWLKANRKEIYEQSESLLIFNTQQSGYYRVNYEPEYWKKLINHLTHNQTINEINRAALIDDLMNLARADYISYEIAIQATLYLKKENSYIPWRAFFNNLPYLNNRFAGRGIEGIYKKWLTSLIEPLYAQLGFEDKTSDDNLTMMLRIHSRKWACELEVADCKYYAAKYFERKLHSGIVLPNYRDVVYCTAMRMDKTKNSYEFLWNEYLNSNVTTDKLVILKSLACSENEEVLEMLLKEAIANNSDIRYHDSAKVFSNVYEASLTGIKVVMKVIEENYDDILRRHYNDYTKIANIVEALASRLSRELYDKFQTFLKSLAKTEPEFKNLINLYLATAKRELNWYDRKATEIFEVLDNLYSSDTYRLPQNLEPKHYDLDLYNINFEPNKKEGTFAGKVEIQMNVLEESLSIILNSHKLNISNITITRGDTKISVKNYKTDDILQQLKIYLSPPAYKGEVINAEINFKGILNDDMKGFYRSSYFDRNGRKHWLATTQFAPTYARQAFPCFDEPGFKSKFNINIERLNHYNSLSNMPTCPEDKNPENDDYKWDKFCISVDMSTYLVAFVVSDFKPAVNSENITLNVWGRPEIAAHGKHAQDIGVKIIRALENITDIKYALPKLDLIGIPDFSMGAMENWGLATFREYGLFYDDKETTSAREKYIITVIAHELSHMWFGNLVTCEWWDYIWLNEGFAQYFESFISDQIFPKYKFMDQFVVYELQSALLKDATNLAHPMTHPVQTPKEIADIFDYVTYDKSASFLRMMFNAFDQEAVTSALRDYLKKRSFSTARTIDLWESFQPLVRIPIGGRNVSVEEIMNTWTDQPGYPVVNATLVNNDLTLTQERFLINRDTFDHEFYWTPVDVFVSSDLLDISSEPYKTWLGPEPQTIYINPNNNWFIVNYKQTGFYRVNYDTASWKALINKLKDKGFEAIHVLNRAQIMDDLFNLARANYVDYELLMEASMYLKQETNHLPWKAFFNGLSYIHDRFQQKSSQKDLNEYVLDLLSNIYAKLGFNDGDDDEHLDKLNREMILQWACKLNKEDCIKKSVDLFAAWRDRSKEIPRNARPAVYCTAIKEGSSEDWEYLLRQYGLSNLATEKMTIINALGCSTNEKMLQKYLGKTMEKYSSNYAIRRQDVSAVFTSVYSAGPVGVKATINFLIKNVKELNQYLGSSETANLIANMASYISSEEEFSMLTEFVVKNINLFPSRGKVRIMLAVSTAKNNLFWFLNNNYKIRNWIMSLKPEKKDSSSTKIESLNIVLTTLIALISYILSHF